MSHIRMRFWDPYGHKYGIPTFPWQMAPDGLATRRQLAAAGLRPGGQSPAAQVMWVRRGSDRVAYLYEIDRALTKRPATPAQLRAVRKANRARRICPTCGEDAGYTIPRSLGECVDCHAATVRRLGLAA